MRIQDAVGARGDPEIDELLFAFALPHSRGRFGSTHACTESSDMGMRYSIDLESAIVISRISRYLNDARLLRAPFGISHWQMRADLISNGDVAFTRPATRVWLLPRSEGRDLTTHELFPQAALKEIHMVTSALAVHGHYSVQRLDVYVQATHQMLLGGTNWWRCFPHGLPPATYSL